MGCICGMNTEWINRRRRRCGWKRDVKDVFGSVQRVYLWQSCFLLQNVKERGVGISWYRSRRTSNGETFTFYSN